VQKYGSAAVQTRQRTHEVLQPVALGWRSMAAELKPKLTFDEYLEIESEAEFKSEFVNGWTYAMGRARPEHNQIVANVVTEFIVQLKSSVDISDSEK
jgi:hypothetical protein